MGEGRQNADRVKLPPTQVGDATLAPPDAPQPEQPAFERYEIVRELARGGMGAVFVARDVDLDRPVALKLMHSGHGASEGEVARFRREAQAVARLQHPGIVQVYDVAQDGGRWYMAMALVEGSSLQATLKRDGPLEPLRACRLTAQLAEAMAYSHSRGVLHRDLKPHNVLLTAEDGQPKIADFGLAKATDLVEQAESIEDDPAIQLLEQSLPEGSVWEESLTLEGQLLGTPAYMPPEQAHGEDVDARGDVYSLGATLYAMLTGRPPFQGASLINLLNAVLSRPPTRPSQLLSGIDPRIERICLKCLEKDPADRYPTAEALAQDLRRCAQKLAKKHARARLAKAAPVPEVVPPPDPTYRLKLFLVSVGSLGFTVATIIFLLPAWGPDEPRPAPASPEPKTEVAVVSSEQRLAPSPPRLHPREVALEQAEQYVQDNPQDLLGAHQRFAAIASRGGRWGDLAQNRAARLAKRIRASIRSAGERAMRAAEKHTSFKRALGILARIEERYGAFPGAKAYARARRSRVEELARKRARSCVARAKSHRDANDHRRALEVLDEYEASGVDSADALIAKAKAETGKHQRVAVLERARITSELNGALAALQKRRYRTAIKTLDTCEASPLVKGDPKLRALLARRRAELKHLEKVWRGAGNAGSAARGIAFEFGGRRRRIDRVRGGFVYSGDSRTKHLVRITQLPASVVAEVFSVVPRGKTPSGLLARGVFLLVEGDATGARAALRAAADAGAKLGSFQDDLTRLERRGKRPRRVD